MMLHSRKKRNWSSRDSYSKHVIGFMEQSMIYLNENQYLQNTEQHTTGQTICGVILQWYSLVELILID